MKSQPTTVTWEPSTDRRNKNRPLGMANRLWTKDRGTGFRFKAVAVKEKGLFLACLTVEGKVKLSMERQR